MAVDIKKLFNQDLPAALAKNTEEAKSIGATYQLNVTGPGGGSGHIHRARRTSSGSSGPPELPWEPVMTSMGPRPLCNPVSSSCVASRPSANRQFPVRQYLPL